LAVFGLVITEVRWDSVVSWAWVSATTFNSPSVPSGLTEGPALTIFELREEVLSSLSHTLFLSGVVTWAGSSRLSSLGEPGGALRIDQSGTGVSEF